MFLNNSSTSICRHLYFYPLYICRDTRSDNLEQYGSTLGLRARVLEADAKDLFVLWTREVRAQPTLSKGGLFVREKVGVSLELLPTLASLALHAAFVTRNFAHAQFGPRSHSTRNDVQVAQAARQASRSLGYATHEHEREPR